MNHDSSQFNSISGVIGDSVTMAENFVECEYRRPRMGVGRRRPRERLCCVGLCALHCCMGGCRAERVKKRKEGEVETNLAGAREGGGRAGDVRPRCYRTPWVYQGPQKNWKKVKQSKNSAQIRLFDLADSYPKSSMR